MEKKQKSEMYPLVKKWQQSGESKRAFSKRNRLKAHVFQYWVKKYEAEYGIAKAVRPTPNFIPLRVSAAEKAPCRLATQIFSYPNGVRLEVNEVLDLESLAILIKLGSDV